MSASPPPAQGAPLSFVEAWYAAASYALQIYFDFSGYSDMAIGLARMLNVRFPLNFASPYQATNIAEFWRRWHITLSRFLRDYVYIPLGGNRHGEARRNVNLMATMLLGGLWHGAAWNFVLWGGLHGLYLVVHSRFPPGGFPRSPATHLTLLAVVVAWVPFRASGLDATMAMLRGMAGCNGIALPQMIVHAFPPLAAIATPVPVLRYPRRRAHAELSRGHRLPAARLDDRAGAADGARTVGTRARLGADRRASRSPCRRCSSRRT